MAAKKRTTKKSARPAGRAAGEAGFSAAEREAMRDRAREAKKASRGTSREEGERDVLEKIAAMSPGDRAIATRLHALVATHAPELAPRTWYGMPAYARDGKVLCFFQEATKFKSRYATLGFSDTAALDDGDMWPTSFALTKLGRAEEKAIVALLKRALG